MSIQVAVDAFWMPKAGNSAEEYEDAYWPPTPFAGTAESISLAIADGATEASFSGPWARLLVSAIGRGDITAASLEESLPLLEETWKKDVGAKPLAWYAEEKLRSGAFAAIVGLKLTANATELGGSWNAFAVGDSCLFHTRGDRLVAAFPLEKWEDFDSRPFLVSSIADSNRTLTKVKREASGSWEDGDNFYLMTDALACWFLRFRILWEPVDFVRSVSTQDEFSKFIELQRKDVGKDGSPSMKNDDVTLLRCTVRNERGVADAVADLK